MDAATGDGHEDGDDDYHHDDAAALQRSSM
jgi:hypothetical protein